MSSNTTKKSTKNATTKVTKTAGKAAPKRVQVEKSGTISNPGLRRLARKGGVKRVSEQTFDQGRLMVQEFIDQVVKDAVLMSEAAKRKTVTSSDIGYSLKRNGFTLYGI